jgi:hypothetical protein
VIDFSASEKDAISQILNEWRTISGKNFHIRILSDLKLSAEKGSFFGHTGSSCLTRLLSKNNGFYHI